MKMNMKVLTLYAGVVLLCLCCFTSHLIGKTFAQYTVSDSASDSARVAAFHVDITSDFSSTEIIKIDDFCPGSTVSYAFTVNNKSEVAVAFSVQAANLTGNLPVVTQLLLGDAPVDLGYLSPGASGSFTFKISWDTKSSDTHPNPTDPSYAGKVDLLQLKIAAEQID